jgi:hypothetical protein
MESVEIVVVVVAVAVSKEVQVPPSLPLQTPSVPLAVSLKESAK